MTSSGLNIETSSNYNMKDASSLKKYHTRTQLSHLLSSHIEITLKCGAVAKVIAEVNHKTTKFLVVDVDYATIYEVYRDQMMLFAVQVDYGVIAVFMSLQTMFLVVRAAFLRC